MTPGISISRFLSRTLSVPEDTTRIGKTFYVDLASCKCVLNV